MAVISSSTVFLPFFLSFLVPHALQLSSSTFSDSGGGGAVVISSASAFFSFFLFFLFLHAVHLSSSSSSSSVGGGVVVVLSSSSSFSSFFCCSSYSPMLSYSPLQHFPTRAAAELT